MKIILSLILLLVLGSFAYAQDPTPPHSGGYVTQQEFRDFISRINDRNLSSYVSVKDYVDTRFAALREATASALAAQDHRLNTMNEWRGTLEDQTKRQVGQDEFKATLNKLNEQITRIGEDIKSLEITRATIEGKASQTSAIVAFIVGLSAFFTSIVSVILSLRNNKKRDVPC